MSRKKSTEQRKKYPVGLRIAKIESDSGLDRAVFAGKLGFSAAYLTQLITGVKTNPSDRFFLAVETMFDVNLDWLKNGAGKPYHDNYPIKQGPLPDLLDMTEEILTSGTDYAESLAANIRSFHRSIKLESRTAVLEDKCDALIKKVENLESKIDEKEKVIPGERLAAAGPS